MAVAQIQLDSPVHDVFLQAPAVQDIPDVQSASVVHVVPHCGTGLGEGEAVGLAIVKLREQVLVDGGTVAAAGLLDGAFGVIVPVLV